MCVLIDTHLLLYEKKIFTEKIIDGRKIINEKCCSGNSNRYSIDCGVSDEFRFAHLNHEDQQVVLDWVNTLLFMKYKLLKEQNPSVADQVSPRYSTGSSAIHLDSFRLEIVDISSSNSTLGPW